MLLGNFLEPFFADRYAAETGRTCVQGKIAIAVNAPEFRVNVDRLITASDRGSVGILEIKSVSARVYYETKRNGLPVDYILQLQYGMLVTGATWGSFCIGNRETGDVMFWDVDQDPDIHQSMLDEVPIFWATVENGPKPEMLDPEDRRCQSCEYRVSCQGAALINIGETPLERDESLRPLIAEYWELKGMRDETKGLYAEIVEKIKLALGKRTEVVSGKAKVYFRVQEAMLQDVEGLVERYEALRKQVIKNIESDPIDLGIFPLASQFNNQFPPAASMKYPSPSRPLRIYGK